VHESDVQISSLGLPSGADTPLPRMRAAFVVGFHCSSKEDASRTLTQNPSSCPFRGDRVCRVASRNEKRERRNSLSRIPRRDRRARRGRRRETRAINRSISLGATLFMEIKSARPSASRRRAVFLQIKDRAAPIRIRRYVNWYAGQGVTFQD